jgi:hypothetical protein
MTKRNLFAQLTEGFDALAAARKGKNTLCTTEVEIKPTVLPRRRHKKTTSEGGL